MENQSLFSKLTHHNEPAVRKGNDDMEAADYEDHSKMAAHMKELNADMLRLEKTKQIEEHENDGKPDNHSHNLPREVEVLIRSENFPTDISKILNTFDVTHSIFPNNRRLVVCVNKNAKLSEAIKALSVHQMMSVPVVDGGNTVNVIRAQDESQGSAVGNVIGVLDMRGILCHIAANFHVHDFNEMNFYPLIEKKDEVRKETIVDLAEIDKPCVLKQNTRVYDAVKQMLSCGSHRAVVVSDEGKLLNIVTQSRVMQLIASVLESIPEKANVKLSSIEKSWKKQVVSIKKSVMVLEAFHLMKQKNLSSLAVVDSKEQLEGVISTTDIKEVGYDLAYFHVLGKSIHEYLAMVKSMRKKDEKRPDVISCRPDESLSDVIRRLNFYRVHRLYVVDEKKRPIGCISLTDILEHLTEHKPEGPETH